MNSPCVLFKFSKLRFGWKKVMSFEDYCSDDDKDASCKVLFEGKETDVYPVSFIGQRSVEIFKTSTHPLYLSCISNACVYGGTNVVTAGGYILYDLLKEGKYRITDGGLFLWRHCAFEKIRPIKFLGRYLTIRKSETIHVDEAISLLGNFSWNYYHFLYEIIQKFYLLEASGLPKNLPLLVDSIVKEVPQFREILTFFLKRRDFIYVDSLVACKLKRLYYPSFVNHIPPDFWNIKELKAEDVYFNREGLMFLRDKCLSYASDIENRYPHKFFISRKVSKNRQYNEEELIEIAQRYGYAVVHPEEMTAKEQFSMFSKADSIIAASGAALTNIICCKAGCKILVLTAVDWNLTIFSNIAGHVDAKMRYLCGTTNNPNDISTGFTINPNEFEKAIIEE